MIRIQFGGSVEFPVNVKLETGAIIEKKQKMAFKDFLIACVSGYEKFKTGSEMGRMYGKIRDDIDAMTATQRQVDFEDDRGKLIKAAVKDAGWLTPEINAAMIPHYDSVDASYDPKARAAEKKAEKEKKAADRKKGRRK